ncbi:MAG: response regulator [Myxococcaceae bacterium]
MSCENHPQPEVLVVDDSRSAAWTLALLLRSHGCVTQIAHGGSEALDCVRQFRPSVALVDIEMPVMDGYEVARRMRSQSELAGMTIIAVSGYSEPSVRERSMEAGFDDYFVKPVNPERLLALIVEAHEKRQANPAR